MGKVVHQCKKYKKKNSFSELIGNFIFLNYWHGFLVWMGWKSISVMVWNLLNKRDSRTNFAKYNKRDVTFIWQSRVFILGFGFQIRGFVFWVWFRGPEFGFQIRGPSILVTCFGGMAGQITAIRLSRQYYWAGIIFCTPLFIIMEMCVGN